MPLLASASGSRYVTPTLRSFGASQGLMPSSRGYNGMFSMHSPREPWVAPTADPVRQMDTVQQLDSGSLPLSEQQLLLQATENQYVSREPASQPVSSPCSGVCVLSSDSEMCTGCFRTKAEISSWMRVSDTERGLIVNRAGQRKLADTTGDKPVYSSDVRFRVDGVNERDGNLSG